MTTSHVIKTYCQENEPDQGGKEPVSNDPGPRAKQARVRLPEMQDSCVDIRLSFLFLTHHTLY